MISVKKAKIILAVIIIVVSLCMAVIGIMEIEISKTARLAASIVDLIAAAGIMFITYKMKHSDS